MQSRPIDAVDLVVVDVETTGLEPLQGDRICEIGAIKWRGGEDVGRFHSMVNPGRSIPSAAFKVNRITPEMIRDAPAAEDILPAFCAFIEGSVLAAYNAKFDLGFLHAEMARAGITAPSLPVIDVLRLARRLLPFLRRYRLLSVASALGIAEHQAHRALEDVELTGRILHRFLSDLKSQGIVMVDDVLRHG